MGQVRLARKFKLPSFDDRFYLGASLGLSFPFLNGNESVTLFGLSEDQKMEFNLPGAKPILGLDIGLPEEELMVVLQTVSIDLNRREVDLVWRGAQRLASMDELSQLTQAYVLTH